MINNKIYNRLQSIISSPSRVFNNFKYKKNKKLHSSKEILLKCFSNFLSLK